MKVLRNLFNLDVLRHGSVATIGNFDGIHRGHQALLSHVREAANQSKLPMLVILFEPQPNEYFNKHQPPIRLSRFREKLAVLSELGVDYVYCLRFNDNLAAMPAHQFAEQFIFSRCQVRQLFIGHDFRFGQYRAGDGELLINLGRARQCVVHRCNDFLIDETRVSSTLIRQVLQQDQLAQATKLLGREYSLYGRVCHGKALARQWGYPTANLALYRQSPPLTGVFCVNVHRNNQPLVYSGVANIGMRPTLHTAGASLEVHLLDFNDDLYGESLRVTFLHKLRHEVKFSSVDELVAQIHCDVANATLFFR